MKVWIVYVELIPCTEYPNGCFVECYVPSKAIEGAIASARDHVPANGYEILEISKCILYDSDEWDDENDPEGEVEETACLVESDHVPRFGVFRTWSSAD